MEILSFLINRSIKRQSDSGSVAVEYALVIGLIVLALVAIVATFDWPISGIVERVSFR